MAMQDIITEIRSLAAGDADRALKSGHDINPFSTQGGRKLWQDGWDGIRPNLLTDDSQDWRLWERGRQARLLDELGDRSFTRPRES